MSSSLLVLYAVCIGLSVIQLVTTDGDFKLRSTHRKSSECGPNEVLDTCLQYPGEDTCYDRGQIQCPASLFLPCYPACVCEEGFINKTVGRECIPKEECGTPCELYEQYTDCKQCSNETCSAIDNPVKCDGKEKCTPGCVCWDGYKRVDENSVCLHLCSCPVMKDSPGCKEWYTPITG